jgi:viroplasmin and RNaseH domain-containing protein
MVLFKQMTNKSNDSYNYASKYGCKIMHLNFKARIHYNKDPKEGDAMINDAHNSSANNLSTVNEANNMMAAKIVQAAITRANEMLLKLKPKMLVA